MPMIKQETIDYNLDFLIKKNISNYTYTPIFDSIDSTNTYIKNNYETIKNKTIIISKHQTNGRGRYDRKFISNTDKGIYCSFLIKENLDDISKNINLKIACALHYAIELSYKIDTKIKWPNDLVLDSRKCAGILIETQVSSNKVQAIIVGFGINIYKQEFENELKQSAIALEDFNNQAYDRNLFLTNLFNHLDDFLYTNNTIDYMKNHMIPIGTYVSLTRNNTKEIVKIIDLNSEGQLIIERINGEIKTLFNEEISV